MDWCLCVQKAHEKSVAALVCTDDNLFSSSHTIIKVSLLALGLFGQLIAAVLVFACLFVT